MEESVRPNLENDPILRSLIQATMLGNHAVRHGQRRLIMNVVAKPDKTYVTEVDDASEAAALPYLEETGLGIVREEAGFTGPDTPEKVLYDGVDGTRSLLLGLSTSTIIAATYDELLHTVTRCVVGEPVSGRVWFAGEGEGTWVFYPGCDPDEVRVLDVIAASARQCRVWDESLHPGKPTYFMDVTPTFKKPQEYERPITPEALGQLLYRVTAIEKWDNSLPGSNGLHHALVANGGFGARAAVTTALGGGWDAASGFMASKAGGTVLGFRNGVPISGLAVMDGDVFISANSPQSAGGFAKVVMECFYPDLYPPKKK